VQEVLTALEEQHAELAALVSGLDEAGWKTPSACAGWSVADVVLHLAQTDEMAIASVEDRMSEFISGFPSTATSIDEGADLMVQAERTSGPAAFERWQSRSSHLRSLFAACDPSARLNWVVGTLSARTLATTRMTECWIHTGDIADGLGVAREPTDRMWQIARLAWRTLPYAFTLNGRDMSGPVAFELTGPDGAEWTFSDGEPLTVVRGPALDLCMVAARRRPPADTALSGEGPDYEAVLDVVRTWA
jgi:uncharacterized protein (TIGR03084 family)